jgi:hypothetical protein
MNILLSSCNSVIAWSVRGGGAHSMKEQLSGPSMLICSKGVQPLHWTTQTKPLSVKYGTAFIGQLAVMVQVLHSNI